MWFDEKDITKYNYEKIMIDNLHGYVLPHAGTKYTGNIISHTMRFKPTKVFEKVFISKRIYPNPKKSIHW